MVSLVFGSLLSGVVISMVSGVECRIWCRFFVTIDGELNEICVVSWVCVCGGNCVSGIIVMSFC